MVYQINKGVSKPISFKGLKGQYIAYLAVGMVLLLLTFVLLYLLSVSSLILLPLMGLLASAFIYTLSILSKRFGEHGLMKHLAANQLPRTLRFRSRSLFINLKKGGRAYGGR